MESLRKVNLESLLVSQRNKKNVFAEVIPTTCFGQIPSGNSINVFIEYCIYIV